MKRDRLNKALSAYKPDKRIAVAVTCSPDADEMHQPDVFITANGGGREQVRMALALAWASLSVPQDAPEEMAAPMYWSQRSADLLAMTHNQFAREMDRSSVNPAVAHLVLLSRLVDMAVGMTPNAELAEYFDMCARQLRGEKFAENAKVDLMTRLHNATKAFMDQPEAAHALADTPVKGRA